MRYSILFVGLVANDRGEDALTLFEQMTIKPDRLLSTVAFNLCANLANDRALHTGRKIFAEIPPSFHQDTILITSALNMFMQSGDTAKAEQLFNEIQSTDKITFATMMKGFNLNNNPLKTLALFDRMKRENIEADGVIYVVLLQACSQIAMIEYCQSIAAQIPRKFRLNRILQNTLIDMWASDLSRADDMPNVLFSQGKAGLIAEAERAFQTIENPDTISFNNMSRAFLGSDSANDFSRVSPCIRIEWERSASCRSLSTPISSDVQ